MEFIPLEKRSKKCSKKKTIEDDKPKRLKKRDQVEEKPLKKGKKKIQTEITGKKEVERKRKQSVSKRKVLEKTVKKKKKNEEEEEENIEEEEDDGEEINESKNEENDEEQEDSEADEEDEEEALRKKCQEMDEKKKNRLFVKLKKKILSEAQIKELHPDIRSVIFPRKKKSRWCWAVFASEEKAKSALVDLMKKKDIFVNRPNPYDQVEKKRKEKMKTVLRKKQAKRKLQEMWT